MVIRKNEHLFSKNIDLIFKNKVNKLFEDTVINASKIILDKNIENNKSNKIIFNNNKEELSLNINEIFIRIILFIILYSIGFFIFKLY
jgi:hypothetical protein